MSNAYSLKYKWTVEVCGKMSHDMPTRRIIVFYSAHVEANGASSWKLGNIGVEWISHTMTARCPRKPMPKQKADPKICKSALKILLYFACGNFSISEINFRSLKSDGYLKFQKSCFHFLESNYRQDFFKMSLRVINLGDLLLFKETWWLWSSTTDGSMGFTAQTFFRNENFSRRRQSKKISSRWISWTGHQSKTTLLLASAIPHCRPIATPFSIGVISL